MVTKQMNIHGSCMMILKRRSVGVLCAFLALLLLTLSAVGLMGGCAAGAAKPKEPVAGPVIDGAEAYHVIVAGGEPEGVAVCPKSDPVVKVAKQRTEMNAPR